MFDWNYLLHAIRNQQQQRNGNKRIFHVLPPLFEKCFIYGNDPEQSNLIVAEYCTQYVEKKREKKQSNDNNKRMFYSFVLQRPTNTE